VTDKLIETLQEEEEPAPEEEVSEVEPEEPSEESVEEESEEPKEEESLEDVLATIEELAKGSKIKAIIAKAKKIRKKGESWKAAIKRAAKMLSEEKEQPEEELKKKKKYPYPYPAKLDEIIQNLTMLLEELKKKKKYKYPYPEAQSEKKEEEKEELAKKLEKKIETLEEANERLRNELEVLRNKGIKITRQPEELAKKTGSKTVYHIDSEGRIWSWD